jgi:hypothetical protein
MDEVRHDAGDDDRRGENDQAVHSQEDPDNAAVEETSFGIHHCCSALL